jgi:hypothetical protein
MYEHIYIYLFNNKFTMLHLGQESQRQGFGPSGKYLAISGVFLIILIESGTANGV